MKKVLRVAAAVLLGLLAVVLIYVGYVFLTYHRIEDNQPVTVDVPEKAQEDSDVLTAGEEYDIMTYNIGFGAYVPEFSFFMDGGTESWALSEELCRETVEGAAALAANYDPDFVLIEEIDRDATRSYHIDQKEIIDATLNGYYSAFAVNYDSAFLFYPFTQPHGKTLAGLALYSKYEITDSLRRSLPISESVSKLIDLDRCYTINRIPVDNGKELVIFCVHLSAYTNEAAVREGQIQMLSEDMNREVEAGNYVICGGDFNHNMRTDAEDSESSWATPLDRSYFCDELHVALDLLSKEEEDALSESCRNADRPYVEGGDDFLVTVDGFIISDNVEMTSYENIYTGYLYSDHDPVHMTFCLAE